MILGQDPYFNPGQVPLCLSHESEQTNQTTSHRKTNKPSLCVTSSTWLLFVLWYFQAHGLCFSVKRGVPVPPSLKRIYKVLERDIPGFRSPSHGCLEEWARQGVLLINATYVSYNRKKRVKWNSEGWWKERSEGGDGSRPGKLPFSDWPCVKGLRTRTLPADGRTLPTMSLGMYPIFVFSRTVGYWTRNAKDSCIFFGVILRKRKEDLSTSRAITC